jgi:hypothetical protein
MLEYLVFVAAFATLVATFIYIRSMFKGEAKPNRVSWLMWAIAPFIATAAAASYSVGWAVLPVFMSGLSPFLIFAASFVAKNAQWKLSSFDFLCGILSGFALALWYVTRDPNAAIVFAIASDALAAIPTLVKAWRHPETESPWPFIVGVFNASTSYAAVSVLTFSAVGFATYLVVINFLLLFSVYETKLVSFLKKVNRRQKQSI